MHIEVGGPMTEADHVYFMRRAAEERAAAEREAHPAARRSHEELALRYEASAAAMVGSVLPGPGFVSPASASDLASTTKA